MIAKISKGNSHIGALRYDNQKEGSEFLDTNCSSNNPVHIAKEMGAIAASNPRCKNNCIHISMSAPQGERLSNDQWIKANSIMLNEMGLEGHQYSMTRHLDGNQDHVHITVNRIDDNGKSWNDSKDFERSHAAMRVVEKHMGLQRIEEHKPQDIGRFERTKAHLNDGIKYSNGKGLGGLKAEMKDRGYTVIVNESKNTGKISGISIKCDIDGKTWKMSELRKGGFRGIEKQLQTPIEITKNSLITNKTYTNSGGMVNKSIASNVSKSFEKLGLMPISSMPTSGVAELRKVTKGIVASMNASIKKSRSMER